MIVATVVGVAGIVAAGGLYALSLSVTTEALERSTSLLRTLQRLDSQWSVEVLRVSSNPQADFDGLAAIAAEVRIDSKELRNIARNEPGLPTGIKSGLLSYLSRIESKGERVERFKSGYSIVRNSQRYIPIAIELLLAKTVEFEQRDLGQAIKTQHSDLDNYFTNPSELEKQQIVLNLDTLRAQRAQYPSDLRRALSSFLAHAMVLLQQKGPLDELLTEATSSTTVSDAQSLAGDLEGLIGGRESERTRYQQLSFGSAILLLTALTFFFALSRRAAPAVPVKGREPRSMEGTLDLTSSSLDLYREKATTAARADSDPTQLVQREYLLQALRATGIQLGSHMKLLVEVHDDISQAVSKTNGTDLDHAAVQTRLRDIQDILKAKSVSKVLGAMQRAVQTIDQASANFHSTTRPMIGTERQVVDLAQCVRRAQAAEVPSDSQVRVESDLLPSVSVVGSADDLTAVIGCIIANSMQAFGDSTQAKVLRIQMAKDQDTAAITITDNGPGMDQKTRDGAFIAFLSTKKGHSGIGLSVALYVIRKHGGQIQLNSVAGQGAAVRILLPLHTHEGP